MKKIFTTFLIIFSVTICRGQWVAIPDANFVAWLQTNYPSCMNGNLMDTTCNGIVTTNMVACYGENIVDLYGIEYFDNLQTLDCGSNQITQLTNLPNTINWIWCDHNLLSNISSLPTNLVFIVCDFNQLTSLPTTLNSITGLSCTNNQLTQLINLPNTLNSIYCSNNQLTSISDLPDSLIQFRASNNPGLMCIPSLEKFNGATSDFDISNTGISCLPNSIQHIGFIPGIDTLPICNLFNANGCDVTWNISGKVYFDLNNNCSYDAGETLHPNVQIQLLQGGNLLQQIFTSGGGTYSFDISIFDTYEVKIDTTTIPIPFFFSCPSGGIQTSIISSLDSMESDINFALVCSSDFDITVNAILNDSGWINPGNKSLISMNAGDFTNFYGANCINGIGGQLQVTITGPAQYNGYSTGSLTPTSVAGNTITWNIVDFGAVDFFHDFHIRLLTDTTATAGDFVCVDATIYSNPADVNQSNNHLNQCFAVVNSFDPNVKEVSPQELTSANEYLTYTIQFQNTGTAPAQHIQILDTLDSDLDLATFQLLAYSHPNMTQVLEGGIVHFNFPNINLPDSTSNEPASHGYIQYKIKPKSATPLTSSFDNTASIYFDFNSPVVTNTTHTSFATGISEQLTVNSNQFKLYPNPAQSQLTVYSMQLSFTSIEIFDVLGRKVYDETLNQNSAIINLKSFSSGVYFIKVQSQNGDVQVKKFVKQ